MANSKVYTNYYEFINFYTKFDYSKNFTTQKKKHQMTQSRKVKKKRKERKNTKDTKKIIKETKMKKVNTTKFKFIRNKTKKNCKFIQSKTNTFIQ